MSKTIPQWTIAYRKPRANRFLRVDDWAGTFDQAVELSRRFLEIHPDLEVWYTTTAATEARYVQLAQTDDSYASLAEDAGNILVDSGRRVRIVGGGILPEELRDGVTAQGAETTGRYLATETRLVIQADGSDDECCPVAIYEVTPGSFHLSYIHHVDTWDEAVRHVREGTSTRELKCDHDRDTCNTCVSWCRRCSFKATDDGTLSIHVRLSHTLGQYDCPHCGREMGH